ncbi:MAG: hypothetical protein NZ551_06725 [Microscillaceae bacterium]|nr:hypothetical protein [Microscillaceae bacterium]MDW8460888.1 hypothetical protein [Cytophagales bacterium]
MKSTITLCLFLLLFCGLLNPTFAQRKRGGEGGGKFSYTLGCGWGLSQIEATGFNFALKRYQENTGTPIGQIGQGQGFSAAVAFYGHNEKSSGARSFYEFRFTNRNQKLSWFDASLNAKRTINFQVNSFGLGFGGLPISSEVLDIGLGVAIEGTWNAINLSESNQPTPINWTAGATAVAPIYINFAIHSPLVLCIRPFYQFQFLPCEWSEFNKNLNPTTYQNDKKADLTSRLNNFGVDVQLLFVLYKKRFR